jgi:alanyl-tRNA synthetase
MYFQVKAEDVNSRVETILEELRATRNEASSLRSKIAVLKAASLASRATTVEPQNVRYLLQLSINCVLRITTPCL